MDHLSVIKNLELYLSCKISNAISFTSLKILLFLVAKVHSLNQYSKGKRVTKGIVMVSYM